MQTQSGRLLQQTTKAIVWSINSKIPASNLQLSQGHPADNRLQTKQTKEAVLELEWKVVPHSAYSSNIIPSDYHLFRLMCMAYLGCASQMPYIYENRSIRIALKDNSLFFFI